jgi:hypothetical protein
MDSKLETVQVLNAAFQDREFFQGVGHISLKKSLIYHENGGLFIENRLF